MFLFFLVATVTAVGNAGCPAFCRLIICLTLGVLLAAAGLSRCESCPFSRSGVQVVFQVTAHTRSLDLEWPGRAARGDEWLAVLGSSPRAGTAHRCWVVNERPASVVKSGMASGGSSCYSLATLKTLALLPRLQGCLGRETRATGQ